MKIQITDRELWLYKVNNELQRIKDVRESLDNAYVKRWRKRRWLPDRKDTEFPTVDCYTWDYPSDYHCGAKYNLEYFKLALESEGTGDIYVDAEELRSIL